MPWETAAESSTPLRAHAVRKLATYRQTQLTRTTKRTYRELAPWLGKCVRSAPRTTMYCRVRVSYGIDSRGFIH